MITRRTKRIGADPVLAEGIEFFPISTGSKRVYQAIVAAKLEGNRAAAERIRRIFNLYLRKYFARFRIAVPRGRGRDSFMFVMWREDPRFVACFDHLTPVGTRHHPAARLRGYPEIKVVGEVDGQLIVLLDDIVTSGVTMTAHVAALCKAGANATALVLMAF